jgi:hypothetical protein
LVVCVGVGVSSYHAVCMEIYSFPIFTQMAALYSKLGNLKGKYVTQFIVLMHKGGKEIKARKG